MSLEAKNEHSGSQRFHALLRELGELHDRKQADYGRPGDPFANVRASEEWGIRPWVGAMIRANDKVRRLQSYARRGTLLNEGVVDSLKDLAVYTLIALVLFEEEALLCGVDPDPSWGSLEATGGILEDTTPVEEDPYTVEP